MSFDPPGFVDVDGTVKTGEDGADTVGLELSPTGKRPRIRRSSPARSAPTRSSFATRGASTTRSSSPAMRCKAILEESGLKVGGDVKLGARQGEGSNGVLARHESEPLSTLLYALGKNSDNFYAEMIFKSIAGRGEGRARRRARTRPRSSRAGSTKNDLGDAGSSIKNGSGLFDANRTTAFSMAKLLRFVWQDPAMKNEFVAQLAIGGVDGTLHKRFRDTRAHRAVRAKTGTLDDAIALSGYVLGPTGKSTIALRDPLQQRLGSGGVGAHGGRQARRAIYERQWK